MKHITGIISALLVLPVFSGCYLTTQAASFLNMQAAAQDIEKLLDDPETSDSTREFLLRAKQIRQYGESEFGLSQSKNYTTYVKLDRPWVALVVQAAPALSTESWLWNYPFVGKLPYRGFYKKDDAFKEAEKLKKQGLDVIIRPVDAFSTLGFFKDPLYSFMEDYSEYELANLILHEETHATLFLKKHTDFNEEFATFVGDTAALLYIDDMYGADAGDKRREEITAQSRDAETFRQDIKKLADKLTTIYQDSSLPDDEKLRLKAIIIDEFLKEFERAYTDRYVTDNYRGFTSADVNNAYISLYLLYGEHRNRFADVYALYNGDLKSFIADVVSAVSKAEDPWLALEKLRAEKAGEHR